MNKNIMFLLNSLLFFYIIFSCSDSKNDLNEIKKSIISKTLLEQKEKIILQEDLRITDKNLPDQYTFQQIRHILSDSIGNIYVLDGGQFSIYVFDNLGKYLRTIGREGQGPGEFKEMSDFHINSNGLLCIYDYINSRISLLKKNGDFVFSIKIKGTLYFMHSISNDKFILLKEAFSSGRDKLELIQTKFDSTKEINYQGNFHKLRTTIFNNTEQPLHFGSGSICTANRQGIVAHSTGESYFIEFYNCRGRKIREIICPDFSPLMVTEQDKQDFLKNFSHLPAKFVKNFVFSKTKNIFKALIFDSSGNLWAIREQKNKHLCADIFKENGDFFSKVLIPQMLYFIDDKYAYSIENDGFESHVIRYKIVKR